MIMVMTEKVMKLQLYNRQTIIIMTMSKSSPMIPGTVIANAEALRGIWLQP